MNTINGLLALQAEAVNDPAAVNSLNNTMTRIQSMMVLYDKLYRSDRFKEISVKEYIPSLIDEIIVNFPSRGTINIDKHIDDIVPRCKKTRPPGNYYK